MIGIRMLFAAAAACFSVVVFAQVPPAPPRAGDILQQQAPKQELPVSPSTAPVLPQVTPPKPALPAGTKVNVTVKDFRFSGNTVFQAAELRDLVREFIGKTLDFNGLNDAAGRVQRHYRERGYFLAVAYLPQQEIRDGIVEIAVLEGRLGQINLQVDPKTKLKESFARGILAAHLKTGDLITENSLERPLLLLRDLPDMEVTSELGPSKTQLGAADLTVKISENAKHFNGYVDADNYGNRFSGEYRIGINLNAGDLTGYGDLLSFRGFVTDESMKFGRLSYVVPLGHYGTRIGVSATAFDYRLGKDFASLGANGNGQVYTIYALHPILRTRNANLFVQGAAERKDLEDKQDSVNAVVDQTITNGKLGVVGDFRDRLMSGGLNSYSATVTSGKLEIQPDSALAFDQAPGTGPQTAGHFSKLNVEFRRLQRLTDQFNLLFAYAAQGANKNLSAAEKMALGGPQGVRAYPVGEAPGDIGQIGTLELRYLVPKLQVFGGDLTLSTYVDHGQVKTLKEPPAADPTSSSNKRSITGAGVGVSLGREGNFLFRLDIATPLDGETPTSDPKKRDPRLWAQAIKW
ncbi:MAG TPA: POTRA domain-containing protein, partial [Burkholderiales bacterium]|nr:POTRA domain-containing protein [Burkholderiales bacterium]